MNIYGGLGKTQNVVHDNNRNQAIPKRLEVLIKFGSKLLNLLSVGCPAKNSFCRIDWIKEG